MVAARTLFMGGTRGSAPAVGTNVIIKLDELDKVLRGDGDVSLVLTNGGRMTGAQLVARTLCQHGLVTLVHPVEGAINLYRTSRYANSKQRAMLSALYPHCVWPGCRKPADDCQYHHIHPWKHGGDTNLNNLIPLCAYHNGVNEDDPGPPVKRGKITTDGNRPAWHPPWGTPTQPIHTYA